MRRAIRDDLSHGGLQSGKREIAAITSFERPRQGKPRRIAASCGLFDRRPARVAEPQQLGGLVEGLAGGIIPARPEHAILPDAGAYQQL